MSLVGKEGKGKYAGYKVIKHEEKLIQMKKGNVIVSLEKQENGQWGERKREVKLSSKFDWDTFWDD